MLGRMSDMNARVKVLRWAYALFGATSLGLGHMQAG